MPRKSDEVIKGFIGDIGTMIDARNKTLEINLKSHVDMAVRVSEERIRKDMATRDDLKKVEASIRKDMATKEDLKSMATKEDLKSMATKEDLKSMATKDDIKRLEQKIDKTTELQQQLDELKERVKDIEENFRTHN